MKRFFPFILSLILVVTCFIAPASASQNESLINLLDYGFITTGGGDLNIQTVNSILNKVSVNLPYYGYVSYVDVLFTATHAPSRVHFSASAQDLTLVHISGNLYRAYGHVTPVSNPHISLYIYYSANGSGRRVSFHSINVALSQESFVSNSLASSLTVYANNDNATVDIPAGDSHTTFFNGSIESMDFEAFTSISDWQGYDFIDFHFSVWGDSVDSVNVYLGKLALPFEMSFVDSNSIYDDPTDGTNNSLYYVSLRIFLDSIDRTVDLEPTVTVSGRFTGNGYFAVDSVFGSVLNIQVSETLTFWNKLTKFFTDLIGSSSDQQQAADDFQESANDQSSRLEYADAEIAEIEKPFLGDMNFEVNDMVDPNVLALSTFGISTALSNNIFLKVLIMALTLALAGFILYGKK